MRISVIGKVSVGKSGFVNTFHNLLTELITDKKVFSPISSMSLQRETFQPQKFLFTKAESKVELKNASNRKIRMEGTPKNINFETIEIGPINNLIDDLIDYPGFDDSNDKRDMIGFIKENMKDITLFIVDASRPLIDKSEVEYLNQILNHSKKLNMNGVFSQVILVLNKYDHLDDEDLNEMYENALKKAKTNVYRWCSYSRFKLFDVKGVQGATAPCDIDGLAKYLLTFKIESTRKKVAVEFLKIKLDTVHFTELNLVHDKELNISVVCNFVKFPFKSCLPDFYFNEELLIKNIKNRFSEHMLAVLNKTNNLHNYSDILAYHFDKITSTDSKFNELKYWKDKKNWQLLDVYLGKNLLNLKSFPLGTIKKFKIDIHAFLENLYAYPLEDVNFWPDIEYYKWDGREQTFKIKFDNYHIKVHGTDSNITFNSNTTKFAVGTKFHSTVNPFTLKAYHINRDYIIEITKNREN